MHITVERIIPIAGEYHDKVIHPVSANLTMKCTNDAIQVFRECGDTEEHPVETLMRDATRPQVYEDTSQTQRMVIAKNIQVRG